MKDDVTKVAPETLALDRLSGIESIELT